MLEWRRTNPSQVLDEALLRPGRFDRVVQAAASPTFTRIAKVSLEVPLPNAAGRLEILKVHLRLRSADALGK